MKNIAIKVVLMVCAGVACFGVSLAGCATTQKVTTPIVSTVKNCADKVTHSVAAGILDDVSAVLVCDASNAESLPACVVAQIKAIAKTNGWPAVDCVIAEVQGKASANAAASEDTLENMRARRAAAVTAWRAQTTAADAGAPS